MGEGKRMPLLTSSPPRHRSLLEWPAPAVTVRGLPRALWRLLRPYQWTKNGLCFAGAIFSGRFLELQAWAAAAGVFVAFSMASSAVYILNDILDRDRDRLHPKKCHRPIASGAVPLPLAIVLAVGLAIGAFCGSLALSTWAAACVALYFANNIAYSVRLKHLTLFDVLCITFGFVLRLGAGTYAIGELPTTWIMLCSFFLAGFLGFAKRRAELCASADDGHQRRPVLAKYSVQYLDSLISSSAIMAIMSYALFTTAAGRNPSLILTLPIVYYAIMYYKRLVMMNHSGEEPDMILLKNRRIHVCIALWLGLYLLIWQGNIHVLR